MSSPKERASIVPLEALSWAEGSEDAGLPSPVEAVALSEVFYIRVFTTGLLLSVAVTAVAAGLAMLHSTSSLGVPAALSILALVLAVLSSQASWFYATLRRRNWVSLLFAIGLSLIALLAGAKNQELAYVIIVVLSAIGVATSLPMTALTSFVAGIGLAAPSLSSPTTVGLVAVAMAVPVFFWLLVEYLARFMLRLGQVVRSAVVSQTPTPVDLGNIDQPSGRVEYPQRQLPRRSDSSTRWHLAAPRWRSILGEVGNVLTGRQEQAVFLMCAGFEDQEIADIMGISVAIVRRHLAAARDRVGAATRGQLAAWAVERGLV